MGIPQLWKPRMVWMSSRTAPRFPPGAESSAESSAMEMEDCYMVRRCKWMAMNQFSLETGTMFYLFILFIYLCVYLCICILYFRLFVCLYISLFTFLFLILFIYLYIHLFVWLFISLLISSFVHFLLVTCYFLTIYICVLFICLFVFFVICLFICCLYDSIWMCLSL